ncbi:chemotaxis signal transduction protein [Aphanothece sacrum FPU1]|uniref:Chemotaxis signal transduction protein n=2 Tax=Aphanothece sacrum TaxID=1122 RepID=A0A401IC79_APHSA|nr:chemotaxis signal transduction protein [Aphanothece sacrum FPU1]GBF83063.1 chemotaxis signal transduction protein [Aphanothece sacrum FPU3]
MLSTDLVSEIIRITPNQIIPIYGVFSSVMGVCNRRGEVLWIIDFASLLTLSPSLKESYYNPYNIIIIHQHNKVVGLAVHQVGQLVREKDVNPPEIVIKSIPWELAHCLNKELQGQKGELLLHLDGEKIFELLKKKEISH